MPIRFHLAVRLLHWTMAAMTLSMLFIGITMVSTAGRSYPQLLALHRPIGIAILVLAAIRLAVRFATPAPPLPQNLSRLQLRAAKGSHALLYAAMLGMPLIGWGMLSAGGYPVTLTSGVTLPPIIQQDVSVFGLLRKAHGWLAIAFFLLVLGHLTLALVHRFVLHDGVMSTMSFGRPSSRAIDPAVSSEVNGSADLDQLTDEPAPADLLE